MSDELSSMIDGAAGGSPEGDASDAIISPELLAEVRASGQNKGPPRATRPLEPEGDDTTEDDTDDGEPAPRPRSSRKWAGYRKHEVEAEADRLAQELESLREQVNQQNAAPDEKAIQDLAFTIKFASGLAFKATALVRGPHWEISEPEADNIGEMGARALGPYAAQYANALPWINLAAALGVPIATRIAEDRRIAKLNEVPPDAV